MGEGALERRAYKARNGNTNLYRDFHEIFMFTCRACLIWKMNFWHCKVCFLEGSVDLGTNLDFNKVFCTIALSMGIQKILYLLIKIL